MKIKNLYVAQFRWKFRKEKRTIGMPQLKETIPSKNSTKIAFEESNAMLMNT
uniref:Uncharacterized protein n=1 Tax=Ascaris lumbricoides TaxID=6252 RepID=A0A0M3IEP4_ASCLU